MNRSFQDVFKTKPTDSIHLQGIGRVPAKKVSDFKIGDKFMWNYGYTSKVIGLKKTTPSQITFIIEDNGKLYEKRMNKNRLAAYSVL
jgi:hypothetical protein